MSSALECLVSTFGGRPSLLGAGSIRDNHGQVQHGKRHNMRLASPRSAMTGCLDMVS